MDSNSSEKIVKEKLSKEKIKELFKEQFMKPFPIISSYNNNFNKILLIKDTIVVIIFIDTVDNNTIELYNLFDENPVFDISLDNENKNIFFKLNNKQIEKYIISQNSETTDLKMLNYHFLLYKKYHDLNNKKKVSKEKTKDEIEKYSINSLKIKDFFNLLTELSSI